MRRINPKISDLLPQHGLSIADFAERSGVARSTVFALIDPCQHPDRRGGMQRTAAWKLAKSYAAAASLTPKSAYAQVIVVESS